MSLSKRNSVDSRSGRDEDCVCFIVFLMRGQDNNKWKGNTFCHCKLGGIDRLGETCYCFFSHVWGHLAGFEPATHGFLECAEKVRCFLSSPFDDQKG